jgi:hypothetical protein
MNFVVITREDFESWLDGMGFTGKWRTKPGTKGVYQIKLSDDVGIEINSTIGGTDAGMDAGRASMQLKLVAIRNGKVLNKKAQGQSHFARTTNWRTNWAKGVDRMRDAYMRSKSFYDNIARIDDLHQYRIDVLAMIEQDPNWAQNPFLHDMHDKVRGGGVLTEKQLLAIKQRAEATQDPAPNNLKMLEDLRKLWVHARNAEDTWTMDFAHSLGNQLKAGRTPTSKQLAMVQDKMRRYRI